MIMAQFSRDDEGKRELTRYFNTEGSCNPKEHYRVKLNHRIKQIKKLLVDRKKYFVINRGRQYGKTTTLINGTGNYCLEAQTRDERRTDVIVDYLGEQIIFE